MEWNKETLPTPESIHTECNDYYLVKVKGAYYPMLAMYIEEDDGNFGWYTSYFEKIIGEVLAWAEIDYK